MKLSERIPIYPGGLEIGEEEKKEVLEVLDNKYLFRYYGPKDSPSKVAKLEEDFRIMTGAKHSLALSSCTSALITALVALGVGPGDEVIVPGYTFFASVAAVVAAKAIPVIGEIDKSLTLDPDDIEKKITPSTKAIIVVHMRGAPCKMDKIMEIANRHNIKVVEDVAQATGGTYKGKYLGTYGHCGCFSFQFHKIITAGEGGMLLTDDDLTIERAKNYHDTAACWRPERYAPPRFEGELFCGVNYRMSELHGAVMLAQLRKLDGLLEGMRKNKKYIEENIKDIDGIEFREVTDGKGDTALCSVFFCKDGDKAAKVVKGLKDAGISSRHLYTPDTRDWHVYAYWKQILEQLTPTKEGCPFKCPFHKGPEIKYSADMCPKTLKILNRAVHIDIAPQFERKDCDYIIKAVRDLFKD